MHLLLLLPRLPYHLASSRAAVHSARTTGSAAARQLVRRVDQGARRALAVFMMRARRVSAAVRRGAAADGVAFRAFEEAWTHGCLLSKRWIIGIQGGFLRNFLR